MDKMIGETLKRHWLRHDIAIEQGVAEAELTSFEVKYNRVLPSDLRNYLITINGMSRGVNDEALIRFWMLQEIKLVGDLIQVVWDNQNVADE